jgi:hypothetical protein
MEDYQWLVSDAAAPWLDRGGCLLRSKTGSGGELAKLASALRKDLSAERAHLVLEQVELRKRAAEKFSLAERMFFGLSICAAVSAGILSHWADLAMPWALTCIQ